MILSKAIDALIELKFVEENTKVYIVVTKRNSVKIDETLFECNIPAKEAKRFFGELEITLNQIRKIGEAGIPEFWFSLACDE